jgi:protein N-terminal asparagine amidohydrolase
LQGGSGRELVAALASNPALRDAADRLKATPERQISAGEDGEGRHVYVFQREYATVDPARVEVRGDGPVCLPHGFWLFNPG